MYYAKQRQDTPWEEERKITIFLFMDDLKLYEKRENEIKGLRHGMEFDIKKCGVITMNRGKVKWTDGIELPSGEKISDI